MHLNHKTKIITGTYSARFDKLTQTKTHACPFMNEIFKFNLHVLIDYTTSIVSGNALVLIKGQNMMISINDDWIMTAFGITSPQWVVRHDLPQKIWSPSIQWVNQAVCSSPAYPIYVLILP